MIANCNAKLSWKRHDDFLSTIKRSNNLSRSKRQKHIIPLANESLTPIKIDENGNKLWDQFLDPSAKSVISGNDGGYVIAGDSYSHDTRDDICVTKIDENGNELWHQIFGGVTYDLTSSVIQSNSGGYVIAGETQSYGAGLGDVWIIKIDENGNELWNKTFGGTDWDVANSIIADNNGGYVIAGAASSYFKEGDITALGGPLNAWFIKTDDNGNAPASPSNNEIWDNVH